MNKQAYKESSTLFISRGGINRALKKKDKNKLGPMNVSLVYYNVVVPPKF